MSVPEKLQQYRLRKQLDGLSLEVKESARVNYLVSVEEKMRDLQTHQCETSEALQKLLRQQLKNYGLNPDKFRIGGFENGMYERFFKVEPREYMSQPQFLVCKLTITSLSLFEHFLCSHLINSHLIHFGIGLRKIFGDEIIKFDSASAKLHESFDYKHIGLIKWRHFMYLMMLLMQPTMTFEEQLKYGFAIAVSYGQLDLESKDRISFGI
jgi:hypothetical protein